MSVRILSRNFISKINSLQNGSKPMLAGGSFVAARNHSRYSEYENLEVTRPQEHVLHILLNRPTKRNALSMEMFAEINDFFLKAADDSTCRAIVLSGSGKMFCAGIDFMSLFDGFSSVLGSGSDDNQRSDVASKAKFIQQKIKQLQAPNNAIQACTKPVIAAVHSGCIGAGLDMISACDVRYASNDAFFSIREVVIGMVADLGTMQRLPKIVGNDGLAREMAFTGDDLPAKDAKEFGLITRLFATPEECLENAMNLASKIAKRSPVAVQGSKVVMNHGRDHTIASGLEFIQVWNQGMLQSEDFILGTTSAMSKEEPNYQDY